MIAVFAVLVWGVLSTRQRAAKEIEGLEAEIAIYTQAVDTDPTGAQAYYNRGMLYRELGEYQKAIADFTTVIELAPENALAHRYRSLTYAFLGDNAQCARDYAKSIELERKKEKPSAPPQEIELSKSSTSKYTVLVSSLKSSEKAHALIESLEALELNEDIQLAYVTVQSEPWYRITLGLFEDKEEARTILRRIQLPGIEPLVIAAPAEMGN
ncbi:MAG: tetratricopeptide repeat protein [Candidatus Poribacteria bacterium]|nr:tetratricopeptide repeat protein [Candidatus Poribacteria bacterium]